MQRLRATFLAGAALVAASAPALAQNVSYQVGGYPNGSVVPGTMGMCMNSAGKAMPCALSDLQPATTPPFRGATVEQRGQVVALSPNGPTNAVSGKVSGTSTGPYTIIPAQLGRIFVTGVQCFRTDAGTSAIIATLSDIAATVVGLANSGGGGGNNMKFDRSAPLIVAAGSALTFTPSSGVTTAYCNAQGFVAP